MEFMIPCEKCGHPHPTQGIGDGEIAAVLRERDALRARVAELEALARQLAASLRYYREGGWDVVSSLRRNEEAADEALTRAKALDLL